MSSQDDDDAAPRTILFVRHGESSVNAGGTTMPHADIPLTGSGIAQAHALAMRLPAQPARILTSSFLRAQQTAAPYCERTGVAAEVEMLLHEFNAIDPAHLAGLDGAGRRPIAEAFWARADPHEQMGEAAESFHAFAKRVRRFLHEVLPTLPDGTVVFGHGQWIALLCWTLLGLDAMDDGMRRFRRFSAVLPLHNGVVWAVTGTPGCGWAMRVVS